MAEPEARGELRASETNRSEDLCTAAISGLLSTAVVSDHLLACFLMTVCIGSGQQSMAAAAAVDSAAVELAAAAAAIQIAQQPSLKLLHSVALFGCYVVRTGFLRFRFNLRSYFKLQNSLLLFFCKLCKTADSKLDLRAQAIWARLLA